MPLITVSSNSVPSVAVQSQQWNFDSPTTQKPVLCSVAECFCVDPVCLVPPDVVSVDLASTRVDEDIESLSKVAAPVGRLVISNHGNDGATA